MNFLVSLYPSFNVLYLFISLSIFLGVFVFWNEGKRDGFDKYRLFDIVFSLSILSLLLYVATDRWLANYSIIHYNSFLLLFTPVLLKIFVVYVFWYFGIHAFARAFTWSVFRLLDIFTVSIVIMSLPLVVYYTVITRNYTFIALYLPYLVCYKLIFSRRNYFGFISGFSYVLFNVIHAISLLFFPFVSGRLPIALFLITISLLTIYFRKKKAVSKTNLSKSFIEFVKSQLKSKDSDLLKQEQLLASEDPYLQAGRGEDNAESMDEAILEDVRKEVIDARLGLIRSMRVQVKRALSFLKLGKYGICEICGNPIDPARLKVYPEATTCIEHATRAKK